VVLNLTTVSKSLPPQRLTIKGEVECAHGATEEDLKYLITEFNTHLKENRGKGAAVIKTGENKKRYLDIDCAIELNTAEWFDMLPLLASPPFKLTFPTRGEQTGFCLRTSLPQVPLLDMIGQQTGEQAWIDAVTGIQSIAVIVEVKAKKGTVENLLPKEPPEALRKFKKYLEPRGLIVVQAADRQVVLCSTIHAWDEFFS